MNFCFYFEQDWYREQEPDADDKGLFNTALPVILFQMIEQNVCSPSESVTRIFTFN